MRPLWNKRFGKHRKSNITGRDYEGFYVTVWNTLVEMKEGKRAAFDFSSNLTDHQRKNVKRAVAEVVQFAAVVLLANLLDAPDDWKDGGRAIALANYLAKRLKGELGMFVPSPFHMPSEWLKTVQSPAASLNALVSATNFIKCCMYPPSWSDELQNGRYKGMSHLEKAAYMLPIPVLSYYRQYDKMWNRMDEMADYYTRSR
jgi:hypothetical protein